MHELAECRAAYADIIQREVARLTEEMNAKLSAIPLAKELRQKLELAGFPAYSPSWTHGASVEVDMGVRPDDVERRREWIRSMYQLKGLVGRMEVVDQWVMGVSDGVARVRVSLKAGLVTVRYDTTMAVEGSGRCKVVKGETYDIVCER